MRKSVGGILRAESRIGEVQKAGLAELEAQHAEVGRRLDGAQRQIGDTLREQYTEMGRRILRAESRIGEAQRAGLAELEAQHAEVGRRLDGAQRQIGETALTIRQLHADTERANENLALANQLLNKERYSVFKPLLRWAYRLGIAFIVRLPGRSNVS